MSQPAGLVLDALRGSLPQKLPVDPLCWARAIDFSIRVHAEVPFAVRVLRAPWASQIPSAVRLQLEGIERRGRMVLALLDCELEAALQALAQARIPALLLKGADVGRRFYPERILRPMGDVDLLVPADSYRDAWNALEANGFSATEPRYRHSFRSAVARTAGCPSIDLHFSLIATDTPSRIERLWERSVAGRFSDLAPGVRALATEDCLVYVLRHSAVLHVLESPIWLGDLAVLITGTPGLDWDFVLRELAATRSQAAAWFVFRILAEHWRTPIPTAVLAALEGRVGLLRRASAGRRLALEPWFPEAGRSRSWMFRSRYLLRDNARDAAQYIYKRWRSRSQERLGPREPLGPAGHTE